MAVDGVCEGRQSVFAAMYVIGSIRGETAGYGVIKFEDEGDSEANVMDLTGDIEDMGGAGTVGFGTKRPDDEHGNDVGNVGEPEERKYELELDGPWSEFSKCF